MELQVGVKILLQRDDGCFLLLKRSPEKYPEVTEPWDIVGGRIDPGVPLLENLKREIHEETQLTLAGAPRLIAAQDILRIGGRHVVRLTYIGATHGEPALDDDHTEFHWYTKEELKTLKGLDRYIQALLEDSTLFTTL